MKKEFYNDFLSSGFKDHGKKIYKERYNSHYWNGNDEEEDWQRYRSRELDEFWKGEHYRTLLSQKIEPPWAHLSTDETITQVATGKVFKVEDFYEEEWQQVGAGYHFRGKGNQTVTIVPEEGGKPAVLKPEDILAHFTWGTWKPTHLPKCPTCQAKGEVEVEHLDDPFGEPMSFTVRCDSCHGSGRVATHRPTMLTLTRL